MAVTVTAVPALSGTHTKTWDVTWSADADITAVIPHGFGEVPWVLEVHKTNDNPARIYEDVTKRDATNAQVKKDTTAGTGGATARVQVSLPHSVVR